MHLPMTLRTEVSGSAPEDTDALGWGALAGLSSARAGFELDIAWCRTRRF